MNFLIMILSETTAYSWWNCQMSSTSANCCQLIPQDRATVFPALGQLAAAELTHITDSEAAKTTLFFSTTA